ncbi:MAG: hypothetical protein A3H88_02870 [Candidatus Blackburnbacteria bacterium RIFCSPLOWO2_02_FULL_44_9]|uniref:Uncharacterized protein n=1 Tax=Candidatus Blackburnbacteria bacterium RIFCSPHIGHO2_02_FULL_44_20 TaxID=1797516 RepID=A0A1G1V5V7_9BACT|nr:MAG: hypothetical protein A3D26_02745 [Candidatus Blackburnbacteria bacterium RIFCSPHIGHO2_02_FULL_44_20]OGY13632.1 MAG: hypothetical protein A3A62_00130 [Candidatus Blackburnbacteria bacterium RIFCSPLOWO2_01_FULL_44_43]OGY17080.1 MAG: hypothetical protein A3H88_02870 [Candidatus Blackburnbacteria bacterium RIFCSPLOWO2_02_FULL_44_9]
MAATETGKHTTIRCTVCVCDVDTATAPHRSHRETVHSGEIDLSLTECPKCGLVLVAEVLLPKQGPLVLVAHPNTGVHAVPVDWLEGWEANGFRQATPLEALGWYQERSPG